MTDSSKRDRPDDSGSFECPIPIQRYPRILAAHGGGGRLMHQLIDRMFVKAFDNPVLKRQHDGAVLSVPSQRIAMTTDSPRTTTPTSRRSGRS